MDDFIEITQKCSFTACMHTCIYRLFTNKQAALNINSITLILILCRAYNAAVISNAKREKQKTHSLHVGWYDNQNFLLIFGELGTREIFPNKEDPKYRLHFLLLHATCNVGKAVTR